MTITIQSSPTEVVVNEQSSLIAINEDSNSIAIIATTSPFIEATAASVVRLEFFGEGPQGVVGPQGEKGIELDETAKIDGSVVYYDAASSKFKADATVTKSLLTDGGNF